jgi:hypothetical protein
VIKSNSLLGYLFELESGGYQPPSGKNHMLLVRLLHVAPAIAARLALPNHDSRYAFVDHPARKHTARQAVVHRRRYGTSRECPGKVAMIT